MSVQRIGLALAALVASAGSSLGQAPTTIWTRSMPANQLNLQAQLGDEAGAIFVFPTQNSGSMLQLSPYAAPTAQPLVSGTYAPGNGTLRLSVAARAATAATVNWATGSGTPRLNFWRLGEAQPDAGWNLPFAPTYTSTLGVHCTADGGGAYVWVLDQSASNLALWRVAANGQLAWTTTVAAGTSPSVRPTEDGTRVLVVGTLRTFLLDGSNGATLHESVDFTQTNSTGATLHGISRDGLTFALSKMDGAVVVWQSIDGTWTKSTAAPAGSQVVARLSLDPAGLRLALHTASSGDSSTLRLAVHERASSGSTAWMLAHQEQANAPANGTISSGGLLFLEHGLALASGHSQGALTNGVDVKLLRRSTIWASAGTLDLPGSISSMSGWGDGRRFLAVRYDESANSFVAALHATSTPDLVVLGEPALGSTVRIEVQAGAGQQVRLLCAPRAPRTFVQLGALGELRLERQSATSLALLTAGGNGSAFHDMPIAASASLAGTTMIIQGLALSPRRLTRDWAKLTLVP
jgi:hypothetical protein